MLEGHGPLLDKFMSGKRPLIFLTGHYGNWEMAGYVFGMFGFPTVAVARTLDNPYLERYLRSFRERTGQELVPKSGGFDQMVEVLRNNRALSFLADQDAGQRGLYVDFFGRPASTHKAIALLAIEHQAPVIVGVARRIGPGFRYEFFCADVIDPAEMTGSADDIRLLTARYTKALEQLIRQDPTQYLWLHRRWKHQPQAAQESRRDRGPCRESRVNSNGGRGVAVPDGRGRAVASRSQNHDGRPAWSGSAGSGRQARVPHFSNIWSTGTIFTLTFLSGKAAMVLSSARMSAGVPAVS